MKGVKTTEVKYYSFRLMVVRFYPEWHCSMCRRSWREDRTHYGRDEGVMYVYCPRCGACLGCRTEQ